MKSLFVGLLMVATLVIGGIYVKNPEALDFDFSGKSSDSTAEGTGEGTAGNTSITAALKEPAAQAESETQASPFAGLAPSIDSIRIDKDGSVVLAGRVGKDGVTRIVVDGTALLEAEPDASGQFAAMFDLPMATEPRVLTLQNEIAGGDIIESDSRIIISPETITEPKEPSADMAAAADTSGPTVLRETAAGVDVVQSPQSGDARDQVALDAITYSEDGHVTLKGRGGAERNIQVYIDNQPVTSTQIQQGGQWTAQLEGVKGGTHTLRVDEVGADGKVASRIETPFKREDKAEMAQLVERTGKPAVVVQPGASLWAISRKKYGDGMMYVRIFEANKEHIRDPDLIYPGQVFALPN